MREVGKNYHGIFQVGRQKIPYKVVLQDNREPCTCLVDTREAVALVRRRMIQENDINRERRHDLHLALPGIS